MPILASLHAQLILALPSSRSLSQIRSVKDPPILQTVEVKKIRQTSTFVPIYTEVFASS